MVDTVRLGGDRQRRGFLGVGGGVASLVNVGLGLEALDTDV